MKNKALAVLFLTIFLDLMGFGLIIPILPTYAKTLGATDAMVGLLGTSFSIMQFIFASFWGGLSDRFGRRPIMLISIAIMVVAYVLFANATVLWLLFATRLLKGFGAANLSVAQAYISDVVPQKDRTKAFGVIGAAFGLGFIFGPSIGGVINEFYGVAGVGYFAACLGTLNFILAWLFLKESLVEKSDSIELFPNPFKDLVRFKHIPEVNALFTINFVYVLGFSMMQITATLLWAEHFGLSEMHIGYTFAYVGLLAVIIQGGLIGKFNSWFGERNLLVIGTLLAAIGLFGMPFVPTDHFSLELVCMTFLSLGNALLTPTVSSLLSSFAPEGMQGKILGTNQSVGSLARVVGPAVGGVAYGWHFSYPYLLAGSISLIVSVLAVRLRKKHF
jgi:DHA1 family tetracycline resistance protein-like MFS transporter